MLERNRLKSKKISKTESVQSQLDERLDARDIHIGPSDYVPWQRDNKVCFIRVEGRGFGGAPIELDMRLSVEDSPNSAGVVIDAIRCVKLALERGEAGPLVAPSAYYMKVHRDNSATVLRSMPATRSSMGVISRSQQRCQASKRSQSVSVVDSQREAVAIPRISAKSALSRLDVRTHRG